MSEIKKALYGLYAGAKFQELFDCLNFYLPADSEASNSLIHLQNQYNRIQREFIVEGISSYSDKTREHNRIMLGVQSLIAEVTEGPKDGQNETLKAKPVVRKFLIVAQSEKNRAELEFYFNHLGITYFESRVLAQKEPIEDYQFILFDASEIKSPNDTGRVDGLYLGILSSYLSDGQLVIYYGKTWNRLDDYRNQVHAANSRFSLYHRVKEMEEVIRNFKA